MAAFNRRQFLKASGAGAAAAFSSYPGGAFAQGIGTSAPFDDYKALIEYMINRRTDTTRRYS